ncbi:MAG: hypothetical protein OEM02_13215, partial [Desulfobulbaceae bacterium]|nr:hypothetical protein [Desulfobulbaceae bacterium]
MKKQIFILASLSCLFLNINTLTFASEEEQVQEKVQEKAVVEEKKEVEEQEPYYDISNREETAREGKMLDEAEKRWRKKPPHSHTLDDAKNSARQGQQSNPRFLLRESSKESKMNEI